MLNKKLILPSLLSISFHAALMFTNVMPFQGKRIDVDVIRAPSSIELSMIQATRQIEVKAEMLKKEKEAEEEAKEKEVEECVSEDRVENIARDPPEIGAIGDQIPELLTNKPPTYPRIARINGWSGEVTLLATVGTDGRCISLCLLASSGHYVLDKAALRAVESWRFKNVSDVVEVKIPIKFVLVSY